MRNWIGPVLAVLLACIGPTPSAAELEAAGQARLF